jgi:2-polyprenyl-3-methyl-5-hydroxy-6-metoxy-1,4-benzoquinol methylase
VPLQYEDCCSYFDSTAERFHSRYHTSRAFRERLVVWKRHSDRVLPQLRNDELCLDLGVGDGSLSIPMALRGVHVCGIDQSAAMLRVAQANAEGHRAVQRFTFICSRIPISAEVEHELSGRVGLILCSSVLEYIDDHCEVLRQCHRMLATGGVLLLSVPNRDSIYRSFERFFKKTPLANRSYLKHQRHQFSRLPLTKEIYDIGFDVLDCEYYAAPFHSISSLVFGESRPTRWATLLLFVLSKTIRR